ncbi:MAG: T9SS type A sorting domain-containing protein [Ignavibacteria bacterium]|nr:T9SS type A sorting domain-containing protein [Ignavibacteria bacterium]
MPESFLLQQNYPNPFNPSTSISYSIKEMGLVTLKIFDVLGREVSVLVNEVKEPGKYSINFDASKLSSGVYIYYMNAGNFISTKKMILTK